MKRKGFKASFTLEATVWISMQLFIMMMVVRIGISFYMESAEREAPGYLKELDVVREFYNYEILKEVGEEMDD